MSAAMEAVTAKLRQGQTVILDGATGTELERLGVPMDSAVWSGRANMTHPHRVLDVHRRNIEAGAEVITANTYPIPLAQMVRSGLEVEFEPWNRAAVQLARQSRAETGTDSRVAIAGSVTPFMSSRHTTGDDLYPGLERQSRLLADAGVDLILLENLAATPDIVPATIAAATTTGLPVWLALSCLEDRESGQLLLGCEETRRSKGSGIWRYASYGEILADPCIAEADVLLTMHSVMDVMEPAIDLMRRHFAGPVGVYPNAGYWERPNWVFTDQVSPAEYAARARSWIDRGAAVVGGCCGIGPDHIAALGALR